MKSRQIIRWNPDKKYGNRSCEVDGHRFDSVKEANYYNQLKLEKRGGLIKDFEMQKTFDLYGTELGCEPEMARQKKVCSHRVDFLVTLPDGNQEVREVKGFATSTWDLKMKLFQANYPDITYKVIR